MTQQSSYLEREGLFCYGGSMSSTYLLNNFGEQKDSRRTSAPKYSFGRSTRAQDPKRYVNKQIARSDGLGSATSLSPHYMVTDKFVYNKSPAWKLSQTPRDKLNRQAQYDYYYRQDDLNCADKNRRIKPSLTKIGSAPRFQNIERFNASPGPEYFPKMKPEVNKEPAYSIKMRRKVKGQDLIQVVNGTDQKVGPATYRPQKTKNSSRSQSRPKWTMPKSHRSPQPTSTSLYQTYDTSGAMGTQLLSSKQTRPKQTINCARRRDKPKIFSAHMQFRPTKVSIPEPYF